RHIELQSTTEPLYSPETLPCASVALDIHHVREGWTQRIEVRVARVHLSYRRGPWSLVQEKLAALLIEQYEIGHDHLANGHTHFHSELLHFCAYRYVHIAEWWCDPFAAFALFDDCLYVSLRFE